MKSIYLFLDFDCPLLWGTTPKNLFHVLIYKTLLKFYKKCLLPFNKTYLRPVEEIRTFLVTPLTLRFCVVILALDLRLVDVLRLVGVLR